MNEPLPPPAELWLSALAGELWSLASDERDAVVAELRGHLAARAAAGRTEETLRALGSPASLAAAYDLPGRQGTIATVPDGLAGSGRRTVPALLRDVRATLRASRNGLMLVGALLFTFVTSTTFLLWLDVRMPTAGVATVPAMAVRIGAVLLAFSAAYRLALAPTERAWAIDRGFLAFAGGLLAATAASVAMAILAGRLAGVAFGEAARRPVALVMLIAGSIALLRVQPWLAALAARRGGFGVAASWRGTRGRMATIVGAWAAIVLPLYLLHTMLNVLALKVLPFGAGSLALAAVDAVLCTGIVIGAAMLNCAVYRWIVGEAVPAPSPFATGRAEPELVDEARARLNRLLHPSLSL
jgi:hypothetical protein